MRRASTGSSRDALTAGQVPDSSPIMLKVINAVRNTRAFTRNVDTHFLLWILCGCPHLHILEPEIGLEIFAQGLFYSIAGVIANHINYFTWCGPDGEVISASQ